MSRHVSDIDPQPPPPQSPVSPSHRNRWRRRLWQVALVLVVFWAVQAVMTRDAVKGPAPPLAGWSVQGPYVRLQEVLETAGGDPVMVHFWATWCPICRAEMSTIAAVARDHAVITVAMQSDPAAVTHYLNENGLNFVTLVDDGGALARRYGVRGVPATFIIAADGEIDAVDVGFSTELGLRVRLWLAGWRRGRGSG